MRMDFLKKMPTQILLAGVICCQGWWTIARGQEVAPLPPMGWNSFDAYDCRISEQDFREVVEVIATKLKPYGWKYCVIDYCWFNPAPGNWENPARRFGHPDLRLDLQGRPLDRLAMDEWGRLLPAPERFPSARSGQGFKPLSDFVHSKGLKFGIHIMRGIPRQAYFEKTPILDSPANAFEIGEPYDTCGWCNNMFGINASRTGAQEYYDSLFALYAQWGVDFVKVDDIMFPQYHQEEIELIRRAMDRSGRPMVLSLSCGEAPLGQARHLVQHANMWRVSADFWDEWSHLRHSFRLQNAWSSHVGPNHWPDADMIPIGRLSLGGRPHGPERESQFTLDECRTLMTLFSIAKSPLMWGGDPLTASAQTISLLTNREVLAVNQSSNDNRQLFQSRDAACWIATEPETGDRYVALFNLSNEPRAVSMNLEWEQLRGEYAVRDLWEGTDIGSTKNEFARQLPPHGAGLYRLHKAKQRND